jgi:hypothetical protein
MTEVSTDQLKAAVESQHGGTATFVESVPVTETFEGKTVWDGAVAIFDLSGNKGPNATRAYAWSSAVEGSNKRRFFAVLHLGGIRSPLDAVKTTIVAESRDGG